MFCYVSSRKRVGGAMQKGLPPARERCWEAVAQQRRILGGCPASKGGFWITRDPEECGTKHGILLNLVGNLYWMGFRELQICSGGGLGTSRCPKLARGGAKTCFFGKKSVPGGSPGVQKRDRDRSKGAHGTQNGSPRDDSGADSTQKGGQTRPELVPGG